LQFISRITNQIKNFFIKMAFIKFFLLVAIIIATTSASPQLTGLPINVATVPVVGEQLGAFPIVGGTPASEETPAPARRSKRSPQLTGLPINPATFPVVGEQLGAFPIVGGSPAGEETPAPAAGRSHRSRN
jgi:hypothetical protein